TFYEFGRAREHTERDAHEGRAGQIAGCEVSEQARSGCQRSPLRLVFPDRGNEPVEPSGMAEFLLQQDAQIVRCQLTEKRVQTPAQCCGGKTGGTRAEF